MCNSNVLVWALLGATVFGGENPTRKPEDYPAQGRLGDFIIAAENLGPSVPSPSGGLYVQDYLVIEVALFPAGATKHLSISQANFGLRINGSRSVLRPDSPGFVSASIKYPNWEQRGQLEASAGMGNAGVILGRQDPVERFPGDRRPIEQRRPVPNPVPRVDSPVDQKREELPVEEQVQRASLAEGEMKVPVTGCLYFRYKGKLSKIKKLELVYEGPSGAALVRIP